MTVHQHLKSNAPLLWVATDEPRRVIDDLTVHSERTVYRMDVMDGLSGWIDDQWKIILVEQQDMMGEWFLGPTRNLSVAIHYCLDAKGVFVIENAHFLLGNEMSKAEVVPILQHVAARYVDAMWADDNDKMPLTVVLVSCKDEAPPEIIRDIVRVTQELPDEVHLTKMITHVSGRLELNLGDEHIARVVKAGQGMSEFEFLQATAKSLLETKTLDHELINRIKIDNLKSGGVLEMRIPKITMAQIGGLDQVKDLLKRAAWMWNHPNETKAHGIDVIRKVLLIGVPGTGKSAICEAAANELDLDLAQFGASKMMSKWVGESEQNMRRAFKQVAAMKPLALWIDEFGRDMSGSGSSGDSGTTDRVHGEYLQGIQELPEEVFLMCAANRIDSLPPEMLRAGRFDKIMFVGFPTEHERADIFRIHLGARSEDYDVTRLAKVTPLFTGAEIQQLIKEVRFRIVGDHHRAPTTEDLLAFAPKMKGRVWTNHTAAIRAMYERAVNEWDWASSAQEADAQFILAGAAKAESVESGKKVDLNSMLRKGLTG